MKLRQPPADPETDLLHAGATISTDPRFVPEHLRADFLKIDPEVEEKLRWQLRTLTSISRTFAGRPVVLEPSENREHEAVALIWLKVDDAARAFEARRQQAEQQAHHDKLYRCPCCGVVEANVMARRHTTARTFVDGTVLNCCGNCADIVERLVRDRIAAQRLATGMTRAETVRVFYETSRE